MESPTEDDRYERQTDLIRRALSTDDHSLNVLLEGMRERGESAIYLCGSRLDSDCCFGSEDIGVLVSVLPEDADKAATPGYHPGSTEVYVTFQGCLTIEYLEGDVLRVREVAQHEVAVLPPGRCHRVRPIPGRRAASLVVKTNLSHDPSVVRCDTCAYVSDPATCALHQSWKGEEVVAQSSVQTEGEADEESK